MLSKSRVSSSHESAESEAYRVDISVFHVVNSGIVSDG